MKQLIIILLAIAIVEVSIQQESILINPAVGYAPCTDDYDIYINYEPGLPPEEENKYNLSISKNFPLHTNIIITFDSDASITLEDKSYARVSLNYYNSFTIRFFKPHDGIKFTVKGLTPGVVPYITSLVINSKEYCAKPYDLGHLDYYIQGFQDTAESPDRTPKGNCGRRQVTHTELIVNGATTKPGDWPWHVALYKIDHANIKYICGGTLISKNHVLTAAHCVTLRSVPVLPETISVVLGKFNLIGGDTESQEREVYSLTVHQDFNHKRLDSDIALLKLKSEAVFNDYIQPACIWYPKAVDRLPSSSDIYGTIVGWGFENTDALAPQLRQAKMPIISESNCLKSNPLFYAKLLTDNKKFCAGYHNGTSACNGDSGSGFQVFLPDKERDDNPDAVGAWYIRGIVSVTLSRVDEAICNPNEYVVFTDIEKYKTWIDNNINDM
ncbi:chymotrypsin-C-like [Maniola hyperantus]|uniref:chymotrypsin-C-like n=1 Tax=Aphantopus hyperantus TaxID=2795564 RepID=UPI00212C018D